MTDTSGTAERAPTSGRSFIRRVVYPVVVILAILGVIWWLDQRGADESPTGEEYGPRDLPAALVPASASVMAAEGSLAPDFLLEDLPGGEARLSDYRGHPVVLNFWATWCKPCRQEMPQFVEAYDKYRSEGLVVIGLNLQEGKAVIKPFVDDYGMDFPVLIDRDGEVGDRYRLLGLPTTFFIDRDGVIRSIFTGPLEDEVDGTNVQGAIAGTELDARIAEILGGEESGGGG
jgi:peroxiredoxin